MSKSRMLCCIRRDVFGVRWYTSESNGERYFMINPWAHRNSRKIYVEDDHIETDVRFCISGSDPIDRLEVPGVVLILFQCRVIFSTAAVSELYLWHPHWLVLLQFFRRPAFSSAVGNKVRAPRRR